MDHSAARGAAVAALVLVGMGAGFPLGAWLSTSSGPMPHGEAVIAQALTALFIGGPIGALAGAGAAGFVGYRFWRRPSWSAVAAVWALAAIAIGLAVRFVVST